MQQHYISSDKLLHFVSAFLAGWVFSHFIAPLLAGILAFPAALVFEILEAVKFYNGRIPLRRAVFVWLFLRDTVFDILWSTVGGVLGALAFSLSLHIHAIVSLAVMDILLFWLSVEDERRWRGSSRAS